MIGLTGKDPKIRKLAAIVKMLLFVPGTVKATPPHYDYIIDKKLKALTPSSNFVIPVPLSKMLSQFALLR